VIPDRLCSSNFIGITYMYLLFLLNFVTLSCCAIKVKDILSVPCCHHRSSEKRRDRTNFLSSSFQIQISEKFLKRWKTYKQGRIYEKFVTISDICAIFSVYVFTRNDCWLAFSLKSYWRFSLSLTHVKQW